MTTQDRPPDGEAAVWAAPIEDETAIDAAGTPPEGYRPVSHGLKSGVHCGRADETWLSLAITRSVFVELGWPLRSPYTLVPVSCWLDEPARTLVLIRDPLGESLWRTASNSYGEPLFANPHIPFNHPILGRLPPSLIKVPHQARGGTLFLDLDAVLRPIAETDATMQSLLGLEFDADLQRHLTLLPVGDSPAADSHSVPLLSGADQTALRAVLDAERLARLGWTVLPDGSVSDSRGTAVLPAGFAVAIRKLLGR